MDFTIGKYCKLLDALRGVGYGFLPVREYFASTEQGEKNVGGRWCICGMMWICGRRWDGFKVSVRDKIPFYQDEWCRRGLVFRSTQDIIDAAASLPPHIMITTHPQRWNDGLVPWGRELVLQGMKNVVKRVRVAGAACSSVLSC